ncbi:MAG: AAA15 family ATPase/GTPase [Paraglaciecola sp.]|jgi:AAA15 family ATPase/GTPase
MIIEFAVENFRSIKSRQVFNMVRSKTAGLEVNSFDPSIDGVTPLLCSSAIYGANAAGKSNFIKALDAMQDIVLDSAKNTQRGNSLPVIHHKLCETTIDQPTEFEVIFVSAGVKYQYGFSATKDRVMEEWLYAFPKSRPQRWFIREYDKENQEYVWDFSSLFTGKKQVWKDATKGNSLFLSTAIMLNNDQLKPVYDWFAETLKVTGIGGWSGSYTAEYCTEDTKQKKSVLKFLNSVDLDISDLSLETKKFDTSSFPENMPKEMKEKIIEDFKDKEYVDIKTVHETLQGNKVLFDLEEESDGTRKLFSFAGPWLDALQNGLVLFIDELHDNLHPNIVKFLVSVFHCKKSNPNNAQLIFTTHESSILDQDIFRRDQIWFCKKEKDQSSNFYPLTDFSPRKGTENLEKSYLAGRYGALPVTSFFELNEE